MAAMSFSGDVRFYPALVVALTLLLVSCGQEAATATTADSGSTDPDDGDQVDETDPVDEPEVLVVTRRVIPDDEPRDAALVGGILRLEDGCLYLEPQVGGGDAVFAIVWPPGTTWDGTNRWVRSSVGTFSIGDAVETGGGYHSLSGAERFVTDPVAFDRLGTCAQRAVEIAVMQ